MAVFITVTDANYADPSFWAGLDITVNSTIDTSALSDTIQVVLTNSTISFTDTNTGNVTSFDNTDLSSGSFSQFVQFIGNDADNNVSGSVGLNGAGYVGGDGDDTLTDDGTLGGAIKGGDGNDVLQGGSGNNNIDGQDGDDVLRGGSGSNNILHGGDGNDTLFAEDGGGNLDGGDGDDVIVAGLNTSFVQGGSGNDSLTLPEGSVVNTFSDTGGNVILPNGNRFTYLNVETVTIACFAQDTTLATPSGDIAVQQLAVGDLVETADHGPKPIRWIGQRRVPGQGAFAPVTFEPGSIGNSAKIRLSPQHRVLLSGWLCELMFEAPEVLCAAKHLCNGDQIYQAPCPEVTYYHIMFDQHEVVFSNGARLESFYTGDHLLDADSATYDELTTLFPELVIPGSMQAARPFIKAFEARAYLAM